jgi:hypothetical protein
MGFQLVPSWITGAAACFMVGSHVCAQSNHPAPTFPTSPLTLQQEAPETVYAPPTPVHEQDGFAGSQVNFSLEVSYFNKFVYRGVEVFPPPDRDRRLNLQVDSELSFDLGKLPSPFVAVFVNAAEADEVSSFQIVRPTVGFDWTSRPISVRVGHTNYIYPDRSELDTADVFVRVILDDSWFFATGRSILSPYVLAAYDYDLYKGVYIEAGVQHVSKIEDWGLTITLLGHAAWVSSFDYFATAPGEKSTGFHHWQVGLVADYSLNRLFNIPQSYGDWTLRGSLYYTDRLDTELRSDDVFWGGVGIRLRF